MSTTRKFIIGVNGRSGTTLYAELINGCFQVIDSQNNYDYQTFIRFDGSIDRWAWPIQHTHIFETFVSAPQEFERVWARRNFFDAVLSNVVAKQTNTYHVYFQQDRQQYTEKFSNVKLTVDPKLFAELLNAQNYHAQITQQYLNSINIPYHVCLFHIHALDHKSFYQHLNLLWPGQKYIENSCPKPLPVSKYNFIDNLGDLLQVYNSINLPYDLDRDNTIQRLTDLIC